jgi:hypothetical protein
LHPPSMNDLSHFGLILCWKQTLVSGSSCVGIDWRLQKYIISLYYFKTVWHISTSQILFHTVLGEEEGFLSCTEINVGKVWTKLLLKC